MLKPSIVDNIFIKRYFVETLVSNKQTPIMFSRVNKPFCLKYNIEINIFSGAIRILYFLDGGCCGIDIYLPIITNTIF